MAKSSIYAAFERMWQHIVTALNGKADAEEITTIQSTLTTMQDDINNLNNGIFTDESTGEKYKLVVVDGNLTMTKVMNVE